MTTPTYKPREPRNLVLRRWGALLSVLAILVTICGDSRADGHVPVNLQAQLVSRLGSFDRNFQARAGALARVLVMHKGGDEESKFSATSFAKAVTDAKQIGGISVAVEEAEFTDARTLGTRCRAEKISLLYLSDGLEAQMPLIAAALDGADVLSIGASGKHAESGAVVGFDLVEARPKLVLNLRSAKAQNVSFKAELLKLGRIVE
jgi:hypothetical protein